jgi:hypothetical protein
LSERFYGATAYPLGSDARISRHPKKADLFQSSTPKNYDLGCADRLLKKHGERGRAGKDGKGARLISSSATNKIGRGFVDLQRMFIAGEPDRGSIWVLCVLRHISDHFDVDVKAAFLGPALAEFARGRPN